MFHHPGRHNATWRRANNTTGCSRQTRRSARRVCVRSAARSPIRSFITSAWRALLDTNPRSVEILLLIAVATETMIAMNRQKGQLLLRQGETEAAEELYRRARSIAEEQEAKLWELRAAASLARLRGDEGR